MRHDEDDEDDDDAPEADTADGEAEPGEGAKRRAASWNKKSPPSFCSCCQDELKGGQTGLCRTCKKRAAEAIAEDARSRPAEGAGRTVPRPCLAYCRKCNSMKAVAPLNRQHSSYLVRRARETREGQIGMIVYEKDAGCPDCADDSSLDPHGIITRFADPTRRDVA